MEGTEKLLLLIDLEQSRLYSVTERGKKGGRIGQFQLASKLLHGGVSSVEAREPRDSAVKQVARRRQA
jgi:hypothetical protein